MPHAELRYSSDLQIDAAAVLARIEEVIQAHDAGSGACKGRAYPAQVFHHTHCLLTLSLLTKPHRDAAFTHALMADVEAAVKAMIPQSCYFSLGLEYSGATYVTNRHEVAA
ncbi:hypothetical protein EI983_06460 [Roseovarius faecimaris]|uniref:5-carboxymethyl-2-hydroxymuconate isomerase n=1 Tax=Roseovarius faecimaris TaxID=2494550 RepID=A0A6I6IQX2_9RHOB|nr:hypothetical protein [Roseovarius faecimaris]QGX97937.1 hypothetical protein EI983_06460 [Roseovarius faecimaris]